MIALINFIFYNIVMASIVVTVLCSIPIYTICRRLKYSIGYSLLAAVLPIAFIWFIAFELWPLEKAGQSKMSLRERVAARKEGGHA